MPQSACDLHYLASAIYVVSYTHKILSSKIVEAHRAFVQRKYMPNPAPTSLYMLAICSFHVAYGSAV